MSMCTPTAHMHIFVEEFREGRLLYQQRWRGIQESQNSPAAGEQEEACQSRGGPVGPGYFVFQKYRGLEQRT